jgi:adenine-specific DNA-methyltransferase
VALGRKFEAIAPLLWMKSGSIGPVVGRAGDEPWSLPDDATYGILFRTSQAKDFSDALASRHDSVRHIFIVSDSESAFQAALEYLPTEVRLGTTRLYSDYLHSFEINGKG